MGRASSSKRSRRPPPPPPTSKFSACLRSFSGMEKRKKVKFSDSDDGAKEIPSIHKGRTEIQNLATNGSRTSEFLYFKKIWGNSRDKEIAQSSNLAARKSDKEISIDRTGLISPPNTFLDHDEQLFIEEPPCSGINETPIRDLHASERLFPVWKITPLNQRQLFLSPEASRSSDKRFENGGVFLEKRRQLIKLASKTLGVEVDEFASIRSDLIGELMLRLGIKPHPDLEVPCNKSETISSSNSYENLNFGDKIQFKNSDNNSNNLLTLPSNEYNDEYAYNSSDCPSPYRDLAPHDYLFREQVHNQSQSLIPYGYGKTSYSDLHGFQSPAKQFNSGVDIKSILPLAFYNYVDCNDDYTQNFGDFNGCISEELFYKSPERKWNYALEWKSSLVCERENSFSQICDVDFASERSLVSVKEDPTNGSFGFDSNIRELDSRFYLDEREGSSSWHSHHIGSFDFDFFE